MARKEAAPGSVRQELGDIWKKNKAEQDARKARRKAELEMEGTAGQRARAFLARWLKRLFYTAFAAMAVYLLGMVVTLSIPLFVSIIVSSLGYTLANVAEIMLTAFCGLFFVLWCFALSLFAARGIWRVYAKAMRGTAKRKPEQSEQED